MMCIVLKLSRPIASNAWKLYTIIMLLYFSLTVRDTSNMIVMLQELDILSSLCLTAILKIGHAPFHTLGVNPIAKQGHSIHALCVAKHLLPLNY